jgi:GntR family transcriptional regulator
VINPNTVAKVYRELEHEGVIELRQGSGAYVADRQKAQGRAPSMLDARPVIKHAIARLSALGLNEEEMRRLFEAELTRLREGAEVGTRKR